MCSGDMRPEGRLRGEMPTGDVLPKHVPSEDVPTGHLPTTDMPSGDVLCMFLMLRRPRPDWVPPPTSSASSGLLRHLLRGCGLSE